MLFNRAISVLRPVRYQMLRPRCKGKCHFRRQVQTVFSPSSAQQADTVSALASKPITAEYLVQEELADLYQDIRDALSQTEPELKLIAQYYFNGEGKAIRPLLIMCLAKAINFHLDQNSLSVKLKQREVAMIVEMIHTATLVHDDVIDAANSRRGGPSVNILWNQKKPIMAGVYILGITSAKVAQLDDTYVMALIFQVLSDLVQGELMQLEAPEDDNQDKRFSVYIDKTFRKTASLIAHSCQAVAVLSGADTELQNTAFQFGRQLGMAFQLVDDLLDFVSTSTQLGKPAAADLRLGLATAPVLFASKKFPELNALIRRRFNQQGDPEMAFNLVHQSDGQEQTKELAKQYSNNAVAQLSVLAPSVYRQALVSLVDQVLLRVK